jgi:S1-C subfamily serine protease
MADLTHWAFPPSLQPEPGEVGFDLERALAAVVRINAEIPDDAYTAEVLGTERGGNGVVIRDDGLLLTIGYLITEAATIWITTGAGAVVPGHALAYDFATGFGLVLPLAPLGAKALPLGTTEGLAVDDEVFVLGHGGRPHALKAQVFARREFAGYWEYLLDDALFTTPPHPEWSGAALLDHAGRLVGVGSLFVQEAQDDDTVQGNMFVPIDLLPPILDDLVNVGRSRAPARPWLGLYAAEERNRLVVGSLASDGPAARAGVRRGDAVVEVAGERVSGLADLLRRTWALGPAGTEIPLTLARDGSPVRLRVKSCDRGDLLKKPSLQ